jgi:phage baseplate assembly protein W
MASMNRIGEVVMARDYGEQIEKKYAEEALDRNAKATIQSNVYNCSVRWAKLFRIRKPLIKEVTCEKCGKVFKTNRMTKLCFKCEKK